MMPTSAIGISITKNTGFTLLEVMVTLTLIGIVTSFAILTLPGDSSDYRLQQEADRLQALLRLNREEALLLGQQRGLRFKADGYEILLLNRDGDWIAPSDSTLLQAYTLPAGLKLTLAVDGQAVNLDKATPLPQVVQLSSGESSVFDLTLSTQAGIGYRLGGDLLGNLSLHTLP